MSVEQYNQNDNSIHSEQSFGHMAMFIHRGFSGPLCRIVPFLTKTMVVQDEQVVQELCNTVSLVVYIYYKCTI